MNDVNYISRTVPRKDVFEKVTGAAVYAADIKLPRQLYGAVYRSPLPHARILNIDTSRASALAGVRVVVTGQECRFLYGPVIEDEPFLAFEKVRYVGEPVAAVAAEDPEIAMEAARLIKVEFDELPPVMDPMRAMDPDAPLIHENWEAYKWAAAVKPIPGTNICDHFTLRKGDMAAGWKAAEVIVENRFQTAMIQHVTLETHCANARWDPEGGLTVWTSAQSPFVIRQYLAQALKLPMNKVRVIGTYVGGGFGSKYDLRAEQLATVLALKTKGRPVKVVFGRWEDFVGSVTRGQVLLKIKTGARKDGTLTAQEVKCYWDTGAYTTMGPRVSNNGGIAAGGPYTIPNIKIDGYCICTNKPVAGAYRGFGVPEVVWAHENQMDALAAELNMDPLDLRLRNALSEGDISSTGERLVSVGLKESLHEAGRLIGWQHGKLKEITPQGRLRGKGIACFWKMTSSPSNTSVLIKINDDGSVTVLQGGTEMGQGVNTVVAQIVAQELGVSYEKINLAPVDTLFTPYDKSSTSSRLTFHLGNALIRAARDAKEQLKTIAANSWKVDNKTVEIKGGAIIEKTESGDGRKIMIDRIGESGILKEQAPVIGRGAYSTADVYVPPDAKTRQSSRPTTFWIYGAQAAEVEVDPDTGKVEVLRVMAAHDCGRIINPQTCLQQIEGAIVMGLGHAMLEEMIYDAQGKPRNMNMVDYKIPTSMDFEPENLVSLVEAHHPEGPYGAKGIGETALAPTVAAIGNAVSNAIGGRISAIPIKPEAVLEAIKQSNRGKYK